VLDPATAADYYGYMLLIDGAEAYYEAMKVAQDRQAKGLPPPATQPDPDAIGIKVLDEHTLKVVLARRVAYFRN